MLWIWTKQSYKIWCSIWSVWNKNFNYWVSIPSFFRTSMFYLVLCFWAAWPLKMQLLLSFLTQMIKNCLIEFVFTLVLAASCVFMWWLWHLLLSRWDASNIPFSVVCSACIFSASYSRRSGHLAFSNPGEFEEIKWSAEVEGSVPPSAPFLLTLMFSFLYYSFGFSLMSTTWLLNVLVDNPRRLSKNQLSITP